MKYLLLAILLLPGCGSNTTLQEYIITKETEVSAIRDGKPCILKLLPGGVIYSKTTKVTPESKPEGDILAKAN